jgi:hypothetical protein
MMPLTDFVKCLCISKLLNVDFKNIVNKILVKFIITFWQNQRFCTPHEYFTYPCEAPPPTSNTFDLRALRGSWGEGLPWKGILLEPRATPWGRSNASSSPEGAHYPLREDALSGLKIFAGLWPRALPWAVIIRAVGAYDFLKSTDYLPPGEKRKHVPLSKIM